MSEDERRGTPGGGFQPPPARPQTRTSQAFLDLDRPILSRLSGLWECLDFGVSPRMALDDVRVTFGLLIERTVKAYVQACDVEHEVNHG